MPAQPAAPLPHRDRPSTMATPRSPHRRSCFLFLALILLAAPSVEAFSSSHCDVATTRARGFGTRSTALRTSQRQQLYQTPKSSPLEDEPWKADGDSYWDMLQEASKDAETFEKFIEESTSRRRGEGIANSPTAKSNGMNSDNNGAPKKKGKYVPIEQWNEEQTENMSREQRLQWDAQRGGDKFRQNEILQRNLKSF